VRPRADVGPNVFRHVQALSDGNAGDLYCCGLLYPQKPTFWAVFQWVSFFCHWYGKFLSQNGHLVWYVVKGPRMCLCRVTVCIRVTVLEIFLRWQYRKFIQLDFVYCFAPWPACRLYQIAAVHSQYNHGRRNTHVRGLLLLQASAYIAVIGLTATFLFSTCGCLTVRAYNPGAFWWHSMLVTSLVVKDFMPKAKNIKDFQGQGQGHDFFSRPMPRTLYNFKANFKDKLKSALRLLTK